MSQLLRFTCACAGKLEKLEKLILQRLTELLEAASSSTKADTVEDVSDVSLCIADFASILGDNTAMQQLKTRSAELCQAQMQTMKITALEAAVTDIGHETVLTDKQVADIEAAWNGGRGLLVNAGPDSPESLSALRTALSEEVLPALLFHACAWLDPSKGAAPVDVQTLAKSIVEEIVIGRRKQQLHPSESRQASKSQADVVSWGCAF